jgi:hypothetical protein
MGPRYRILQIGERIAADNTVSRRKPVVRDLARVVEFEISGL